jgi:hypothetical protein
VKFIHAPGFPEGPQQSGAGLEQHVSDPASVEIPENRSGVPLVENEGGRGVVEYRARLGNRSTSHDDSQRRPTHRECGVTHGERGIVTDDGPGARDDGLYPGSQLVGVRYRLRPGQLHAPAPFTSDSPVQAHRHLRCHERSSTLHRDAPFPIDCFSLSRLDTADHLDARGSKFVGTTARGEGRIGLCEYNPGDPGV